MADEAIDRYRDALQAWATPRRGSGRRGGRGAVAELRRRPAREALLANRGPDAVAAALHTMVAAQALDRISDHSAILGARVRYLITGDPAHLAAEVR